MILGQLGTTSENSEIIWKRKFLKKCVVSAEMSQKLLIMVDFLIVLRTQNETHHKNIKHEKLF